MILVLFLQRNFMKKNPILKYCLAIALAFGLSTQADATAYLGYELETIASGLNSPLGICVDSSDNIYFAAGGDIKQILASTGYSTINTLVTGLSGLQGLCVDSANNLYASQSNGDVRQILANDGYSTVNILATGLSNPQGICVDSLNNLYLAEYSGGRIKQILASGGYSTINTLATGFSNPQGICVDDSNNLYFAEGSTIRQILASGGYSTVNTLATGLNGPVGICVDDSNNLYLGEFGAGTIKQILASGGYSTINTLATGVNNPYGIAIDSVNNPYFTQYYAGTIRKLLTPPPPPVLEIDFTNGAQLTAPITGGLKFAGIGDCTFLGSATAGIEINAGNVKVASATSLGTSGVNMTGGSLEATAALTTPALTITNNTTVKASANNVRVATAGGNGSLTLTGAVGNEIVYLDKIASTGGVSSAANRVRFTNLTNLHANTATFGYRLGLDGLPTSNVYGTGAVTAAELIVNTPTVPAGAFGSLTTSRIFLGSNSINQAIIAGSSS